jgi:hypothetical protein
VLPDTPNPLNEIVSNVVSTFTKKPDEALASVSIAVITTSVAVRPETETEPEPEPAVSADIVMIPDPTIDGPSDAVPVVWGKEITVSGNPGETAPCEPPRVVSGLIEPCVIVYATFFSVYRF